VREFETGATRDNEDGKPDYEGFLSPLVLARYAEYMHKNRVQADGSLRASDNWQKGIPFTAYMKSGWRHFMEWWRLHRLGTTLGGGETWREDLEEAICGVLFNAMGYLHELLRLRQYDYPIKTPAAVEWENAARAWLEENKIQVDEGLTAEGGRATMPSQRRSPWFPEERFGQQL
jgi:hypothetical protein